MNADPHLGHTVDTSHVRAPTGPDPEHTRFVVLFCSCGEVDVFPRVNYDLVLPEWRATFERTLRSHGLTIARPEP